MAKNKKTAGAWGIDLGQCALKALRCTLDGDTVVADAFDFIEYPKILTQPEAIPEELIPEALEQFLSRNDVKGDKVAIALPGQSGLAKFFKPPPVDVKRIADIVAYEARQQIPFPLDEVIWDFQRLAGGQEVEGFALDTEVGLFAMKRDQVFRAIAPYQDLGIELDIVQLAPLSVYNFVAYDILTDGPDPDLYDPDDPPESIVVLSMGTDATDLIVTNGFRVWQRSIPIGGNHFTRQLTKDLKLTFAKAEHLKRNARQAEDPKTVFQAMRPIFNDLVTEVQRSVGYFQGIDRKAKIKGIVMLGNTVKLPGLQQYLAKNLGYEVIDFKSFSRLTGSDVISTPAFKDNILSYGVSYGLCLQGLKESTLGTNLVPRELIVERVIRAKKPWVVACVATLLLALSFNFLFGLNRWFSVNELYAADDVSWAEAEEAIEAVQKKSTEYKEEDNNKKTVLKYLIAVGESVVSNAERRLKWLELMKALNAAFPVTTGKKPGEIINLSELPFEQREELFIEHVESEYFTKLEDWYTEEIERRYQYTAGTSDEPVADDPNATAPPDGTPVEKPKGPGWVIEVKGYHFLKRNNIHVGGRHIRETLLANLENGTVDLPLFDVVENKETTVTYTMKELGIAFPVLVNESRPMKSRIPNPEFVPKDNAGGQQGGGGLAPGGLAPGGLGPGGLGPGVGVRQRPQEVDPDAPQPFILVDKYDFTVQLCWRETSVNDRESSRLARLKAEQERKEQEEAEQQAAETVANNTPGA